MLGPGARQELGGERGAGHRVLRLFTQYYLKRLTLGLNCAITLVVIINVRPESVPDSDTHASNVKSYAPEGEFFNRPGHAPTVGYNFKGDRCVGRCNPPRLFNVRCHVVLIFNF